MAFKKSKWLEKSNSTECPAGCTTTLVFNWWDFPFLNPIYLNQIFSLVIIMFMRNCPFDLRLQMDSFKLLISKSCKLINSLYIGAWIIRIVILYFDNISLKYYAAIVFFIRQIVNIVLFFPQQELMVWWVLNERAKINSYYYCWNCEDEGRHL